MKKRICIFLLIAHALLPAQSTPRNFLAIADFTPQGISPQNAAVILDRLYVELLNTGTFRIMERSQMAALLKEQNFQLSGACNSQQCQLEMGKMLGVDHLLIGSIGQIDDLYTISARLLNVETGEILCARSADREGALKNLLQGSISALSREIAACYAAAYSVSPAPRAVSANLSAGDASVTPSPRPKDLSATDTLGISTPSTPPAPVRRPSADTIARPAPLKKTQQYSRILESKEPERDTRWKMSLGYYTEHSLYASMTRDFGDIESGFGFNWRAALLYNMRSNLPDQWFIPQLGGVLRYIGQRHETWISLAWVPFTFYWLSTTSLDNGFLAEIGYEYGTQKGIGIKYLLYDVLQPQYDLSRITTESYDLYVFLRF